ncbi:unnamed protein product [Adineta steineri]|uniref:PDZ domain-containing protein n=1 Tax=Adineta steineri TaxID=433720 RepID=A0A815EA47_9BILA|nr:unnamed protein product [Adineta steineri]CAF3677399.1 unnamed protein product [Adineta steineri]
MTNTEELIVYANSRNGLGIRILGFKRATNKSGIYIKELLDNGLAQKDGRLKIGDQILSINDESSIGISREHAVNLLRSAAATNQVRFRVKHFFPQLSSVEYQKLLHDDKSTDDDDDNHRAHNTSQNKNNNNNPTLNESRTKKSSRRHHRQQQQQHNHDQSDRYSTYNVAYENNKREQQESNKQMNISNDALQALLNSRFKLIDLVDLLKKIYPKLFSNNQKRELQFIEQLSETNTDGRITLKDFERQSSVLLGERINLLVPFFSSSAQSSNPTNDTELILELRREISSCRTTIDDLQTKIITCEKSQRLSNEVEFEYEDLLKFLYEQLHQYKLNEVNHIKQIRANDQLIQKLFHYLSIYVNQPKDEHILAQLKYEYEQQQKLNENSHNTSFVPNNKYHERF